MKSIFASLFVLVLTFSFVAPSYAGCGMDHNNADAQTLMDASAALEGTNPDLAKKVSEVAKKSFPEMKAS